ncbi:MAG: metallophosphoesterase [Pseudomonadota bacterium]
MSVQKGNCLIVHLSDLHIKAEDEALWSSDRVGLIARSAVRSTSYEMAILIVSGDSTFGGLKEEFDIAETFIGLVALDIGTLANCPIKIVVAPGNHDCDFSTKSTLREFAISQKSGDVASNSELINKLAEPLSTFRSFESKTDTFVFPNKTTMQKSGVLALHNAKIQIRVFTSPLFSRVKEVKGDLFLPLDVFEDGWEDDCLKIAVMHHPSPWFDQSIARGIRSALRSNANFVFYGHEHVPEVAAVDSYVRNGNSSNIEIDGAALQEHGKSKKSSFITLEIDTISTQVQSTMHNWSSDKSCFTTQALSELSRSQNWIQLPRSKKAFSISPAFQAKLDDPGIVATSNSGRAISASDLYVLPDLFAPIKGKSGVDEVISAKSLFNLKVYGNGNLLQGDEKFGKTSLLFRLFDGFQNVGLVPIYIPLREHKIKTPGDFSKILRSVIHSVYPKEDEDTFLALPLEQRIFLVDDVDVLKTEVLRTAFVDFLKARCIHFFATTTMKIQVTELLTQDGAGAIGDIGQLRIDKFSSAKRSEMIGKWVNLVEKTEDEEGVLARIDHLEKGATAALGHNMVPRVPHMLLIFLQSSSASSPTKLESGALAHYYTYLVTQHLLTASIKLEEIEEYLSLSRLISFQMHKSERTYITLGELEECNRIFSERYFPGSLNARLNVLRNAKLIEEFGSDSYQWRHGYFHYLFLGGYLGKHIQEPDIRKIVDDMCQHLYVRSNANALIFLVHFSKDAHVFASLQSVVQQLFGGEAKLKLGVDTKEFAEIMKDVRELYVPSDGAVGARKRKHQRADEHEKKNGDGLMDRPKDSATLSTLEELITLFKTAEIIGQVLKEQYASIERSTREPIVVALLDAFLRASGKAIRLITGSRTQIKSMVEKRLVDLGSALTPIEMANEAEKLVADLVQMFMYAFFQKLGDAISSDKTLDLVRNISWPDELEPKVFLLACELNLQRSIPIGNIDSLLMTADHDAAFIALIRNLVQHRISMFHTRAPDLQALGQRFKLPLSTLKAIDFRDPNTR